MSVLALKDLSVGQGDKSRLYDASLDVKPGEFVGLIGPNGSGKSTLLKAALGLLPATGHSSLWDLPLKQRAKHAAYLAQGDQLAWALSVHAVLSLAGGLVSSESIQDALAQVGLSGFENRTMDELSGGQRARVLLARALCQQTPLLLADEPLAALDPSAQLLVMDVLKARTAAGQAVVLAIHDLGLALRYCSRLVLLDTGRVVADGTPEEVLHPQQLEQFFHVQAWQTRCPQWGAIFQIIKSTGNFDV